MGFVVAIANQKGGVGKTTMCLNLIKRLGIKRVIDADNHRGISKILPSNFCQYVDISRPSTMDDLYHALLSSSEVNTLIDVGGYDSEFTRYAIANADLVIIPCNEDPTELNALELFCDTLQSIEVDYGDKIKSYVVPNRIHPKAKHIPISLRLKVDELKMNLYDDAITYNKNVPKQAAKGEAATQGRVVAQYGKLATFIRSNIEQ